jgi:hypothetical protein
MQCWFLEHPADWVAFFQLIKLCTKWKLLNAFWKAALIIHKITTTEGWKIGHSTRWRKRNCFVSMQIHKQQILFSGAVWRSSALQIKCGAARRAGSSTIIASCCRHLTKRAVAICTCSLIMRPFGAIMEQTRGPIFLSPSRPSCFVFAFSPLQMFHYASKIQQRPLYTFD